MKYNACIFLISARKNLLHTCLKYLDDNFNKVYKYPIYIFYHDNIYDDLDFQSSIKSINSSVSYTFSNIKFNIPSHIKKQDLFFNLKNNKYAKNFTSKRINYLHANFFWNNFMHDSFNLNHFDYVMRIDDDSWFKSKIDFDLFDSVNEPNTFFSTGFTWNHFTSSHLETRVDLFNFIKNYVSKYNISVKNKQLSDALNGEVDNSNFHTLLWNCGNLNVYNMKLFKHPYWKIYNDLFNDIAGGYRYRWGDIEIIGLFCYIHFDIPLIDLKLKEKNLYHDKIPGAYIIKF